MKQKPRQPHLVKCAKPGCRATWQTRCNNQPRQWCTKHRAERNAKKSREWHQANNHRYAYKPQHSRHLTDEPIPTIGNRYKLYWEWE